MRNDLSRRIASPWSVTLFNSWSRSAMICALSVVLVACQQQQDSSLTKIIGDYGFSRNVPPSTLYRPGTLVHRSNYDKTDSKLETVQIDFLCSARNSVDFYKFQPKISETESRDVASKVGASFNLGLPALKSIFNLQITAKAANSVVATVSDAKIYAYAPDELAEIRGALGPICRDLVNSNILRDNTYQVAKVLEATVDLRVTFDASAGAVLKAQAVKELLSAGFTVDPASDSVTTKGKALYYGVRIEPITTRLEPPKPQ